MVKIFHHCFPAKASLRRLRTGKVHPSRARDESWNTCIFLLQYNYLEFILRQDCSYTPPEWWTLPLNTESEKLCRSTWIVQLLACAWSWPQSLGILNLRKPLVDVGQQLLVQIYRKMSEEPNFYFIKAVWGILTIAAKDVKATVVVCLRLKGTKRSLRQKLYTDR